MSPLESVLLLIAVGGTAFFLVRAVQSQYSYKSMSNLEVKRVELEAARERDEKPKLKQRAREQLYALGYDGDVFPFAAALAFLYLAICVALTLTNVPTAVAYVAGLPVSVLAIWAFAKSTTARKRKKFNSQFVDMLELVAGQIEGSNGAQRALNMVVPTMQEPLRGEMIRVLNRQAATKDLIGALRELAQRYPSRAFELFISAMEIDQADGHAIAPAIRQAASLLNSDFQLRSEALAEIAQQRGEFFIILGVLGALGGYMIFGGDESRLEAYLSPVGLIALSASLANVLWGCWRMLTMLRNLQGDEAL